MKITKLLKGKLMSLAPILKTEEDRALQVGTSEKKGILSFGRKSREIEIPTDSNMVVFKENGKVILEKLNFDETGRLDYPAELKRKGLKYQIPRSLPESPHRWESRFEHAFTYSPTNEKFYISERGWAIDRYIRCIDWDPCSFVVIIKNNSFKIGEKYIEMIEGKYADHSVEEWFIEKILTEDFSVKEGNTFLKLLKDSNMIDERVMSEYGFEYFKFFSEGKCYYCDEKGILDERLKTVSEIRKEIEILLKYAWITDWDDINNQCCSEEFDGTNLEVILADCEQASDLEDYKGLVRMALTEEDEPYRCFDFVNGKKIILRQEISKVIARELSVESITYDDMVLRLAYFLMGVKDREELNMMVDYVKQYRKSVGMTWPGKEGE